MPAYDFKNKTTTLHYLITAMVKNCEVEVNYIPGLKKHFEIKLTKDGISATNSFERDTIDFILADIKESMESEETTEEKESWSGFAMLTNMVFWIVGNLSKDYFLTIGD